MKKVLCFGELLLRISPRLGGEWIRESQFSVFIGGAELNAATALARWGVPVEYFTILPDNYLSSEIKDSLSKRGIATSKVMSGGNRIGTYYLPQGADLKNAGVIYDRAYSSFWELKSGDIDWDVVFEGVEWFHFSAITPALTNQLALICHEALKAARRRGITTSVDLNYRAKLWQYGKSPVDVMPELVGHCDIIMGNLWAEEKMLGIPVPASLKDNKESYIEQSRESSKAIMAAYPNCRQVANTFRFDVGEGVLYYATLYDGENLFISRQHETPTIVDKIGSGDTFMAGLIYGNHTGLSREEIINFAAAAAFNKLFIKGDATTALVDEIKKGYTQYA